MQVRPLFVTLNIDYFGKLLTFVLPLSQSFKYSKSNEANQLPAIPSISSFSTPRPTLIPRPLSRSNTARDLGVAKPGPNGVAFGSSPPSPSIVALHSPMAVRPKLGNERSLSFNQLQSPLRASVPPSPRTPKQKSFFKLRVENTVAMIAVQEMGGVMTVEVGTLVVFNEMISAKNNPSTPRKSQVQKDTLQSKYLC